MSVIWCFDEGGELLALGTLKDGAVSCGVFKSAFSSEDSSVLYFSHPKESPATIFTGYMIVKPPLHIGTVSTINYVLCAEQDLPTGADLLLRYLNMEVDGPPDVLDSPVLTGDTIGLVVHVVPHAVADPQEMWLQVFCESSSHMFNTKDQLFSFGCVFHNDGSLRYLREQPLWYHEDAGAAGISVSIDRLPTESFPFANGSRHRAIYIYRDERETVIGIERANPNDGDDL
jgi:hypothetical protein